jgi:hypothetical protein
MYYDWRTKKSISAKDAQQFFDSFFFLPSLNLGSIMLDRCLGI